MPLDLRWNLVMAALEGCPDDELWLLGDGPFDHLVGYFRVAERLY